MGKGGNWTSPLPGEKEAAKNEIERRNTVHLDKRRQGNGSHRNHPETQHYPGIPGGEPQTAAHISEREKAKLEKSKPPVG